MKDNNLKLILSQFKKPAFKKWSYKHICFFYRIATDSWLNENITSKCKVLYQNYIKYLIEFDNISDAKMIHTLFLLSTSEIISDDLKNIARFKFFDTWKKKIKKSTPGESYIPSGFNEKMADINFPAKIAITRYK